MLTRALENHPIAGYLGATIGVSAGAAAWMDLLTKVGGVAAMLFGVAAGYYTWRLQRRAWKRAQKEDEAG